MNIERIRTGPSARHRAYALMEDLTFVPNSNAYTLVNQSIASDLGDGSEIIVMDKPGLTMYWSRKNQLAYNWGNYDFENECKIREYRGLSSEVQRVTQYSNSTVGTYTLVDSNLAAKLADGATIIIMDEPGLILFWSAQDQIAYSWDDETSLLSSRHR